MLPVRVKDVDSVNKDRAVIKRIRHAVIESDEHLMPGVPKPFLVVNSGNASTRTACCSMDRHLALAHGTRR